MAGVAGGIRLGIDFGTSNTVAALRLPGREARPLLFDGSPLLPSAVCADAGGHLLVGRDALHAATSDPASFEPHPKRCVDDETVLSAIASSPVVDLIGAVLHRVAAEATRAAGGPPDEVVPPARRPGAPAAGTRCSRRPPVRCPTRVWWWSRSRPRTTSSRSVPTCRPGGRQSSTTSVPARSTRR